MDGFVVILIARLSILNNFNWVIILSSCFSWLYIKPHKTWRFYLSLKIFFSPPFRWGKWFGNIPIHHFLVWTSRGRGGTECRRRPNGSDLCRSSTPAAVSVFSASVSSHLHRPSLSVFSSWWTFWCWCFSPSWASFSSPTSFTCCDYAASRGGGRCALRTMLDLLSSITDFRHGQW